MYMWTLLLSRMAAVKRLLVPHDSVVYLFCSFKINEPISGDLKTDKGLWGGGGGGHW